MKNAFIRYTALGVFILITVSSVFPQWTNRYPKVSGMSHHVYLEGYVLPTLSVGPMGSALSPNEKIVAFSSHGWIWLYENKTKTAKRLTRGGGMDFRPTWSPDGSSLAFVRDDGSDTWIVILDLITKQEMVINTPALELDPVFSGDGNYLYFASARSGTLDIWRHNFQSSLDSIIIEKPGSQFRPQPHPDGESLVYSDPNSIYLWDLNTGDEEILQSEQIISMTRPALSPKGDLLVYNWPTQENYELRLLNINNPKSTVFLTSANGLPLSPNWSANGNWIYFSEADENQVFQLKRISSVGGFVEIVPILHWDWGEPTTTINLVTKLKGSNKPAPSRLSVVDANGHPIIPNNGQSRFDGQNGRVFFYSKGEIQLTVTPGTFHVSAVQGLTTPELTKEIKVKSLLEKEVTLELEPIWDSKKNGWVSGDHHFHLNYGGPYRLVPNDILPMMDAEALDVATPQLANLHNRFEDQKYWGWKSPENGPIIIFAQEIRSHFLGHLGLIGTSDLYWPWIWGPGYQVYSSDDRPNADPLAFAKEQGALSMYVHPFSSRNPFSENGMRRVPIEIVADATLGLFDLIELVCLWSDEIGTSQLWYRFLNIGVPIAISGGTDVMNNFYHTMAIGTTRNYVFTSGVRDWQTYANALKSGQSFVTNGPILDFAVNNIKPGGTVSSSSDLNWTLDLHSAIGVDSVAIVLNGKTVWSTKGLNGPGSRSYEGSMSLPAGGWIAATAVGGKSYWPMMDSYPFAHTAPIWIGSKGSTETEPRKKAAKELLTILDVSEERLREGYSDIPIPHLQNHFNKARKRLIELEK